MQINILISLVTALSVSFSTLAADDYDCDNRMKLAYGVALLRDQGASKEQIYQRFIGNNSRYKTLHGIVNTVFIFRQFDPKKIAALEYEACKKEQQGEKAIYEWTHVSGLYEDGTSYSAASISQGDGAIYIKFEGKMLTVALSLVDAPYEYEAIFVVDNKKTLVRRTRALNDNIKLVLHGHALEEPARAFILSMLKSKSITVVGNGTEHQFSTAGAYQAISRAIKDAGLLAD